MKYIKQTNNTFMAVDETSEYFELVNKLPKDRQPTFLSEKDKEVQAYLKEQAAIQDERTKQEALRKSALAKQAKAAGWTDEEAKVMGL